MSDRVVITGVRPYDGEYELDTDRAFNAREWNWIKRISGYMPLTVQDGFAGGDPELFVALAVIAMCRNGKIEKAQALQVAEQLAEAPFDGTTILLIGETVEESDEVPPAPTSEPDGSSLRSSLENGNGENEKQPSSGTSSSESSARHVGSLPRTGTGASDMPAESARTVSAR